MRFGKEFTKSVLTFKSLCHVTVWICLIRDRVGSKISTKAGVEAYSWRYRSSMRKAPCIRDNRVTLSLSPSPSFTSWSKVTDGIESRVFLPLVSWISNDDDSSVRGNSPGIPSLKAEEGVKRAKERCKKLRDSGTILLEIVWYYK